MEAVKQKQLWRLNLQVKATHFHFKLKFSICNKTFHGLSILPNSFLKLKSHSIVSIPNQHRPTLRSKFLKCLSKIRPRFSEKRTISTLNRQKPNSVGGLLVGILWNLYRSVCKRDWRATIIQSWVILFLAILVYYVESFPR